MAPSLQATAFIAATVFGSVASYALALVAWRRRSVPAAIPLAVLSFTVGTWAILHVLTFIVPATSTAVVLAHVYSAIAITTPVLWLLFVIVYTGHGDWLTRFRIAALWLPVLVIIGLLVTAPYQPLTSTGYEVVREGGVVAPDLDFDLTTAFAVLISYVYVLASYVLLLRLFLRSRNVYRNQTAAILLGSVFPFVGNAATQLGYTPHPALDLTPAMFVIDVFVIGLALFRYDLFNVSPVVGDVLVDELPEPILVLDEDGVVLDHNPAATDLTEARSITGDHADDVVPGLTSALDGTDTHTVDAGDDRGPLVFEPLTEPIDDHYGNQHGTIVVLRDVTIQHRRVEQLEALQSATQQLIGARTETEVAEIAVNFASDVLDQPSVGINLYDDSRDALVPVAATDELLDRLDRSVLVVEPGEGQVWDVYESGEYQTLDGNNPIVRGDVIPAESGFLLPLGDHGVMGIATDESRDQTRAERQLARILARTTETALTRVKQEQELRESRDALERRNDQIEFFNGVLRHNIRNGMLVIDGHARHLRGTLDDGHDELELISEWCDDLTELTEKVRAINETVTATESERLDPVSLSDVVAEAVETLDEEYDDIEVVTDVDNDLVVRANELAVDVVESLLFNAVEHNDLDHPRVEVTSREADERIRLRVADNGPGISDEVKERLFEQEMDTSQTGGGFGLYFVSVMMDLYGGSVWFEDNNPRGAVGVLEFREIEHTPLVESPE